MLQLATLLLRWRRTIVISALLGGALGATLAITSHSYTSSATFIPRGQDEGLNPALALAANQFGIRMPGGNQGWSPGIYVELIASETLLGSIAQDTVIVKEEQGRRAQVMDLLKVAAPTPERRLYRAVRRLGVMIDATEDKKLGAVRLRVTTEWPSVSLQLVQRVLQEVNEFNLRKRKSQAAAERQFVEGQAANAEAALHAAEERLGAFLNQNRGSIANSPELTLQRDRLQRDVTLKQQVYTTLVQSREEAKIREVRDTPVFTVLQEPTLAVVGEKRHLVLKTLVGAFAAGMFAVVLAILTHALRGLFSGPPEERAEFLKLVEQAKPRFLRRRIS